MVSKVAFAGLEFDMYLSWPCTLPPSSMLTLVLMVSRDQGDKDENREPTVAICKNIPKKEKTRSLVDW